MIVLVAIWAFAEALLWFVVADVPISAVGLRRGLRPALLAALVAAVASALGGLALQRLGIGRAALDMVPGIGPAMIDHAAADWQAHGFRGMLAGSFAGVPYKLYAHAAADTAPAVFLAMSVAARLPRFLLVSTVSGILRRPLRRHLTARQIVWLFFGFWTLFYLAYFLIAGL